jgi:ribonuclease P protein component
VKRRLSEIVRAELDSIDTADIVIRALPAAGQADFATLRSGISALLVQRS